MAAPVKTEEEIEALMKTKFESVGGVPGTFDVYKAEIKKAKNAYVLNKDIVIKKKPSIDIVVAYDGACVTASDTTIKASLEAADTDMDVEKVGTPTVDTNDNKCKSIYRAERKTGKPTATSDELKGVLADKYTTVTTAGVIVFKLGTRLQTKQPKLKTNQPKLKTNQQTSPKHQQ